jgi:2-C-methyl-D-erythritol 4-phosphate cytidylyltransferase/2-C-methyl-D-erythritol 4-phosphate cytidylyltransferase/2-C-methyl-D-erythritol 2,4-cyclodiphosphate synthase
VLAAVILAAGASSRFGGIKKEYQKLENSPFTVLGYAVNAFTAKKSVEIIVISISENEEAAAKQALPPEFLTSSSPKILFVKGGNSRRASVYNALSILEKYNPEYVLIHDGARPWVSPSLIEELIEAVKKHGAVIPVLPFTDTPKECDAPVSQEQTVFIKTHLKRANTGAAQTPQAFAFPQILHAHAQAKEDENFTDDAEIWGKFCGQVAVIPGEKENRKITFPEDI